jgi:hypothetical protein
MLEHGFYNTEEGKAVLKEHWRQLRGPLEEVLKATRCLRPNPKPRPWLKKKHTKAQQRKKHERNRRRR